MTEKPPGAAPEAVPDVGPPPSDSAPAPPPPGRQGGAASDASGGIPSDLDDTVVEKTVHALEKLGLEFAVPTNPKLEKMGLERFAKHDAKYPPLSGTEVVHLLDEDEREKIRRLGRNMVLWAFMVGGFSGLISSIASFIMRAPEGTPTTFGYDVLEFAVVNGVTIGITAVEVALLYRKALQTVHLSAREAGIQLVPRSDKPETDEQRAVALALARSALELPNPPQNPFGINPCSIVRRIGAVEVKGLDDMPELLAVLDRLTEAERELVFEVFVLASFPDGTVTRAERKLLQAVLARYGRTLSLPALRRVRRRFERGDAVARSHLRAALPVPR